MGRVISRAPPSSLSSFSCFDLVMSLFQCSVSKRFFLDLLDSCEYSLGGGEGGYRLLKNIQQSRGNYRSIPKKGIKRITSLWTTNLELCVCKVYDLNWFPIKRNACRCFSSDGVEMLRRVHRRVRHRRWHLPTLRCYFKYSKIAVSLAMSINYNAAIVRVNFLYACCVFFFY